MAIIHAYKSDLEVGTLVPVLVKEKKIKKIKKKMKKKKKKPL